MSINQLSTDLQETSWWTQQQQQMKTTTQNGSTSSQQQQQHKFPATQQQFWPSHHHHHLYHQHQLWLTSYNSSNESPSIYPMQNHPTLSFNLNQHDNNDEQELDDQTVIADTSNREQESELEKEPMFEKPLTPSDVGKLNRLVIPKQHAEKYFPLGGDSGDKGLLLSFEDESGKCWRFRYSYWNSSQSYVLTKGWSRYVKEKRLDAGDVIIFERHRADSERLFIGWRRRGAAAAAAAQDAHNGGGGGGGGGGWSRGLYSGHPYPVDFVQSHGVTVPYQSDCLHADSLVQNQTTPVGNSKTLRLFGVNLECQLDESEPSIPDGSTMSSQVQAHHHHQQQFNYSQQSYYNSSNRYGQSHMQEQQDITFSEEDVKEMMRNRQG